MPQIISSTSDAKKNATSNMPTYDLPSTWQYQASLPPTGQLLNFTYKPCRKMNANPISNVAAAITVGLLTRWLGFWISLRPGMIIAENRVTITANVEVALKNTSTTSGKW